MAAPGPQDAALERVRGVERSLDTRSQRPLGSTSQRPLDTRSQRPLGTKSQKPLNKASIIQLATQSKVGWDIASPDEDTVPWHSVPTAEEVVAELASSVTSGLSKSEAARRLSDFGPNKLTPPVKATFLQKVWAQLNSVVIWMLFASAIVKGALQQWPEFGLILAVIIVNTAIGLIQEGRAEQAAAAIMAMLSANARVLRDGEQAIVPAEELVPGDIVLLKSGDKVPADLRLIDATNLQVQEAMLTGESLPVSKTLHAIPPAATLGDRKCMCYSATAVVSGQATGVVVATGDSAEIGQINMLVNTVERAQNNLVHQLHVLGRWLVVLVLIIALVAFLLALLYVDQGFTEAFKSAVSIAVAIIPEGLPAIVTVVLAIGTTVMARNNAIIRQLPAVETLGSINIICSDKTGTLTKNEMTVVKIRTASSLFGVTGVGYAPTGHITAPTTTPTTAPAIDTTSTTIETIPTYNPHVAASNRSLAVGSTGTAVTRSDMVTVTIHNPSPPVPDPTAAAVSPDTPPLPEAQLPTVRALIQGLLLCNDSSISVNVNEGTGKEVYVPLGAPTEAALLVLGQKAGLDLKQLQGSYPRVASVPFESEHKFMVTVHEEGGKKVMYVKGAPDRLLPMCSSQIRGDDLASGTAPLDSEFWKHQQAELSSQGLRVLALCRAELPDSTDLTDLSPKTMLSFKPYLSIVLMVAILDPPRAEAIEAARVAHEAGITVKMITGDHSLTALAIGKMLGIAGSGQVLTGPEIDRMTDEALGHVAMVCNVFARTSPENKLRIVRVLQDKKQVCAMTGDGVNDAPALKAADVGVAMGTGTDVSKEAAKMVLTDDNFATIVAAVREGRRVWDNIRKILIFNLPVNLAQGLSIMYSYILGLENPPITALQVLLVNLLTSVTLGLALAAEPAEPTVMKRPPRRLGKRLVGKLLLWRCFFVCHLIVILVIGGFEWGKNQGFTLNQRRGEAFAVLVGAQVAYFVCCRFLKMSCVHWRVFKGNVVAYISSIGTLGMLVFFVCTPKVNEFFNMDILVGTQWARAAVCIVIVFVVVEIEKALVDPVLMPVIRPVLTWLENHTPSWLSVQPRALLGPVRRCINPVAGGRRKAQKAGKSLSGRHRQGNDTGAE